MGRWKPVGDISKEYANAAPEEARVVYDEAENGVPRPGPYLVNMRRLQLTESSGGNDMFKAVCEIAEPPDSKKAKYNGYSIWFNRVISQDWASAVNAFLHAMLDGKPPATRKKVVDAFWAKNVQVDEAGMVQKIGTFSVPESLKIAVSTLSDNYNGQDRLKIASIMPASNRPKSAPVEEPDEDDDESDEYEEETEAAGRYTEDELNAMKLAELRALAREAGLDTATIKGKAALVDAILDIDFSDEDEDEDADDEAEDEEADDEDEADDEPEGDEYEDLNRTELKKVITEEGLDVKVTRGMSDDDIRAAIREALPEDEEDEEDEEPEPEPEPAKPARRGRPAARQSSAARPAAKRRRGKAGDSSEPPF
jgi:hypothetical protein